MSQTVRIGFRKLHEEMRSKLGSRDSIQLDDGSWIGDISRAWRSTITDSLAETFRLIQEVPEPRRSTHTKALEDLLQQYLGHRTVLCRYRKSPRTESPAWKTEASEALSHFAMTFYDYLWALAEEFPEVDIELPEGHPDAERDYVATRLGRTRSGLDSYVSEWRSKNQMDLTWVIRKPGLPWLVNLSKFEEWRSSSEGAKATVKRKPGRPPKSELK